MAASNKQILVWDSLQARKELLAGSRGGPSVLWEPCFTRQGCSLRFTEDQRVLELEAAVGNEADFGRVLLFARHFLVTAPVTKIDASKPYLRYAITEADQEDARRICQDMTPVSLRKFFLADPRGEWPGKKTASSTRIFMLNFALLWLTRHPHAGAHARRAARRLLETEWITDWGAGRGLMEMNPAFEWGAGWSAASPQSRTHAASKNTVRQVNTLAATCLFLSQAGQDFWKTKIALKSSSERL